MAEQKWHRFFFDDWVAKEGLDLIRGTKVDNVYTMPLKLWARTGGYAVQIQLEGTGDQNAAYVCEIPPGKQLNFQRHLYEELVYVLSGRGATTIWYPGLSKQVFEWKAGSLFAVPLNACYQHFNGSGTEPTRYFAVTTAPLMLNLLRNEDFVFNNDGVFPERYSGAETDFDGKIRWETYTGWGQPASFACANFFPDIGSIPYRKSLRSVNALGMNFELGNGIMGAHAMIAPGGTFTKIHRHGPGSHVLWLEGEGYSLMWPDGGEMVQQFWGPGSIVVPPNWWWHQHCIVSHERARYVALRMSSYKNPLNRLLAGTMTSVRSGGNQMDYEDIPPGLMHDIMKRFTDECAKRGTPVSMEAVQF